MKVISCYEKTSVIDVSKREDHRRTRGAPMSRGYNLPLPPGYYLDDERGLLDPRDEFPAYQKEREKAEREKKP
jgi:hypothetical protein